MNKHRRKEIDEAYARLESAKEIIENCSEEERDYFDNMPEGIQDSDKGQRADEVADELQEISSEIEELLDRLQETKNAY